uniref:Uncharacterized protein n=1 Tax=Rhizophora mucronata TaxID=61149 RepID=A0A2P2PBR1_RHIMU
MLIFLLSKLNMCYVPNM